MAWKCREGEGATNVGQDAAVGGRWDVRLGWRWDKKQPSLLSPSSSVQGFQIGERDNRIMPQIKKISM